MCVSLTLTLASLSGGGLSLCKSLRSLALIDTALTAVAPSSLLPISATLERLNLSQQGLTRMLYVENLPVLRELYLQENAITRIEGLQGCPRLQRIWLYGNKITRIDGLQGAGEVRTNTWERRGQRGEQKALGEQQVHHNPKRWHSHANAGCEGTHAHPSYHTSE